MDLNGNGNVSVDEFAAFIQQSQHGETSMPTAAPTDLTHPPKLVTMETEAAAKRNARRAPAWQGKSLFPSQRARPRGVAGNQHRSAERLRALRSEPDNTIIGGNSTPPPQPPRRTQTIMRRSTRKVEVTQELIWKNARPVMLPNLSVAKRQCAVAQVLTIAVLMLNASKLEHEMMCCVCARTARNDRVRARC